MLSPARLTAVAPVCCAGNGSIDSMPLNAHVTAPVPNTRPMIMCHRFQFRYGIAVARSLNRYRLRGEYIHTPITRPKMAVAVPRPDAQMTTRLHCGPCFLSGVKYNQCGMAPTYAPHRDAVVVN